MHRCDFGTFEQLAQRGNVVPVWREMLADLHTPVAVHRQLATGSYGFLLESVENGTQVGRYSFIAGDPLMVFQARGDSQAFIPVAGRLDAPVLATPIESLRALMARFKPVEVPGLPPFTGGLVGYFSYDMVRFFETIPDTTTDDLSLPDCLFFVTDTLVAFDHAKRRMVLIANAIVEDSSPQARRAAFDAATMRLDEMVARINKPLPAVPVSQLGESPAGSLQASANVERPVFEAAVEKAREYIAAGDIFQVVLSQRFSAPLTADPFDVYRALRVVNPSPYMFYLSFGEVKLAGSSPEILVRCGEGRVQLRPIAGTRPRGATPEEDAAHEADLLADAKEIAEHVMLVDLGRNDVGRVSKFGSVRVTDLKIVERYSHVMHIVSNVEGELEEGRDAFDVLAASFPAGTVSGAPKIRAMEIIDELETTRRGPYAGAVCYMGFNGAMDSCITIRTAVIHDGVVHVQAGAGIVADSVPANEYQESVNKARGMLQAIEWAESGL